jgi:hypothetical protein
MHGILVSSQVAVMPSQGPSLETLTKQLETDHEKKEDSPKLRKLRHFGRTLDGKV